MTAVNRDAIAQRIERLRARPDPEMDRSRRFHPDGTPRRPINDLLIANQMVKDGFSEEDVRHVLGYMPDLEAGLKAIPHKGMKPA